MASTYGTITNRDPDYMIEIMIKGEDHLGSIYAYLPEQVAMSSTSNWSPVMGSLLNGMLDLPNSAMRPVGYQANPLFQSVKGWEGNTPFTFSLDLQFNAQTDPVKDVIFPIYRLLRLTCPTDMGNGLVRAPGPSALTLLQNHLSRPGLNETIFSIVKTGVDDLASYAKKYVGAQSDEVITLKFGTFLQIDNIVVTAVSPRFDTQFHNGIPISAEASVEFEMMFAPTRDMLDNMFLSIHTNR